MWELGSDADEPEWREVEVPFQKTLYQVVQTTKGPYAIGDGGTLLADRGDGWEVILDDGPHTRDNQLRALDVTDDGKRLWFVGSSGSMGCYDVDTRRKYDYTAPKEMTSTWEGIAVAGPRGSEKALAANGSGEIMPFTIDGFDQNWGVTHKPAKKGSKMAALAASPDGIGYAVDTSGNAFRTTPDDGWEDIGIVDSQVKFYDIHAASDHRVYVAAGDGRLYRYDDSYHNWTPIGVTDKTSLRAFDIYRGQMVCLGANGSFYQRNGRERWEAVHTPTGNTLLDVALGDTDVAVGKSGTVLYRPRGTTRDAGTSHDGDEFDDRGEAYDADDTDPKDEDSTDDGSDDGSSGGDSTGGSSSDGSTDDSTSDGSTDDSSDGSTSDGSTSDSSADDSTTDSPTGG